MPDRAVPRVEPVYQRLRAWLGGQQIIDSRHAWLYFEDEHHPRWAVLRHDLRAALEPDGQADPGRSARWTLAAGASHREHAAWRPAALAGVQLPGDLVVLDPAAADLWLEEDRPVYGAPRNPYHRVDVLASSRAVQFVVDGEVVADTTRPVLLIETAVVPRWYVPPGDVAWERLAPEATQTICQYKGEANYFRVVGTNVRLWSYEHADPEVAAIAGMLAIAGEEPGVRIIVDGTVEVHR